MLRNRDCCTMAAEEPEDKGPPRWEVQVVGLQGVIANCVPIFGNDTSTVRDLQKTLVAICGVPTADQKLCVGGSVCRPRQLLDACLAKESKSTVTLIKLDPASRRCQGCGCRGGFGPNARLRRCSGCLDTFFCNTVCQSQAWPRHKRHCFRGGGGYLLPEPLPDDWKPALPEGVGAAEMQARGTLHRHPAATQYAMKYCAIPDAR